MEPVRFGVLGASRFALSHTARAIHEAQGAVFTALATSSTDRATPFAAFAPGLTVYDGYQELLDDPSIEAVYIPLPNNLHVPWTLAALNAGKHVLCEKPIAMRAEEIDPLIAARDRTGLLVAEAYMIVHHPQWHLVRRLLDDGAIGELRHVDTVQTFDVGADAANIRNQAATGGGSIPDVGVYTYGSIRFAARAEPAELSSRIHWENGVDTWAHVVGTMAGAGGPFTFSSMTSTRMAPRQEAVFHGSRGLIRVTAPCNAGVVGEAQVHLIRETTTIEAFTAVRQYTLQMENFARSVRTGADFPWTLEDARGTQAMIDMVFAAET